MGIGNLDDGTDLRPIVLFLDFDGVLHPDGAMGGELFAVACMRRLADVLKKHPQVEVVISSSWREVHPLQDLRDMLEPELGVRILGCTPDRVERIHLPGELWSFARHGQCWAWLAWNRPPGTPWLALDDQAWRFAEDCSQLIVVNGQTGIDDGVADQLDQRIEALALAPLAEQHDARAVGVGDE